MSWRDYLQQASFRGVPFGVIDIGVEVGRKNALHDYPFNDQPWSEDFGLRTRTFTVRGFVVQSAANDFDYRAERDALVDALETKDSGTLVHPTYGEIEVALRRPATTREKFGQQEGTVEFVMSFVRVGLPAQPSSSTTTTGAAQSGISALLQRLMDAYTNGANYAASFLTEGALADILHMIHVTRSFVSGVGGTASVAITEAMAILDGLSDGMFDSLYLPDRGAQAIADVFTAFDALVTGGGGAEVIDASLGMLTFGISDMPTVLGPTTATSYEIRQANRAALVDLTRGCALAHGVKAAVNVDFLNRDEVESKVTVLNEAIDRALESAAGDDPSESAIVAASSTGETYNDEIYVELTSLRNVLMKMFRSRLSTTVRTKTYIVPAGLPTSTLSLAWRVYADAERSSEILKRNKSVIKHPGFLPGGAEIELVLDV